MDRQKTALSSCFFNSLLLLLEPDRISPATGMRDSCYRSLLLLDKYSKYIQCTQLAAVATAAANTVPYLGENGVKEQVIKKLLKTS